MINPLLWDYIGLFLSNHILLIAGTYIINKQTPKFISKIFCFYGHINFKYKTPFLVCMEPGIPVILVFKH